MSPVSSGASSLIVFPLLQADVYHKKPWTDVILNCSHGISLSYHLLHSIIIVFLFVSFFVSLGSVFCHCVFSTWKWYPVMLSSCCVFKDWVKNEKWNEHFLLSNVKVGELFLPLILANDRQIKILTVIQFKKNNINFYCIVFELFSN